MPERRTAYRPRLAPVVSFAVRIALRGDAEWAADQAFVSDLGKRSAMTSLGSLRSAPERIVQASFEHLREIVEHQSGVTLIAHDGARRLGFLLLLDSLPDDVTMLPQAFVAYMAVEPEEQRRGVGAALLESAEREARRRGRPYMALMVTEGNAPARALYQRNGYETERRLLCKAL